LKLGHGAIATVVRGPSPAFLTSPGDRTPQSGIGIRQKNDTPLQTSPRSPSSALSRVGLTISMYFDLLILPLAKNAKLGLSVLQGVQYHRVGYTMLLRLNPEEPGRQYKGCKVAQTWNKSKGQNILECSKAFTVAFCIQIITAHASGSVHLHSSGSVNKLATAVRLHLIALDSAQSERST